MRLRHWPANPAIALLTASALLSGCGGNGEKDQIRDAVCNRVNDLFASQMGCNATPAKPVVSIDVFGARGQTLIARVSTGTCTETPKIAWSNSSGQSLGTDLTLEDSTPDSKLTISATCGTGSATQTLAANSVSTAGAAFAVLQNGKVYLWGSPEWGGAYTPVESVSNISKIIATERGFAALLADNNVMSWGPDAITIEKPADATSGESPKATGALQNLKDIQSGYNAFFATRQDGSFVAWGNLYSVSQDDYFPLNHAQLGLTAEQITALSNFRSVAYTESAYALIAADGTVQSFGEADSGGNSYKIGSQKLRRVAGNRYDFVAQTEDGNMVGWGSGYSSPLYTSSGTQLSNVSSFVLNGYSGAAIDSSAKAQAFGSSAYIESADSSAVAAQLSDVKSIVASEYSFAALKKDGTVVHWGDSPRMQASFDAVKSKLTQVIRLFANDQAFVALKSDGTVVSWGDAEKGGDSSAVSADLKNVLTITGNQYAFAALRSDGSVVSWGMQSKGGNSSSVKARLANVRAIYGTAFGGFLAVTKSGDYVTWGDAWAGGDSSRVSGKLTAIPYYAQ